MAEFHNSDDDFLRLALQQEMALPTSYVSDLQEAWDKRNWDLTDRGLLYVETEFLLAERLLRIAGVIGVLSAAENQNPCNDMLNDRIWSCIPVWNKDRTELWQLFLGSTTKKDNRDRLFTSRLVIRDKLIDGSLSANPLITAGGDIMYMDWMARGPMIDAAKEPHMCDEAVKLIEDLQGDSIAAHDNLCTRMHKQSAYGEWLVRLECNFLEAAHDENS